MKQDNNKSFFIIKPEAFSQRNEIKRMINNQSDLKIISTKIVVLSDKDIDTLYLDDIKTNLMKVIKFQLVGAVVEAGIVVGEDAIFELIKICGEHPSPINCPRGTIRERFGKKQPMVFHGITYYLNAIHKASQEEANSAIEWFYSKK